MHTQMTEKIDRESVHLMADQVETLQDLFPQVFSEGRLDFAKLRTALGSLVDEESERYSFTWAGKRDAIQLLQAPTQATLVPVPEQSLEFDETQNVFIEGDNLQVLKLLYKAYFGQVKLIYIDPPYNTGKDFIYPDNFTAPIEQYLRITGQTDAAGTRRTSNVETSGRLHSAWLSMMYPRLFLGRQLLADTGMIAVSIDDNEVHNLRMLMNEVFGEENFVAELIWNLGTGTTAGHFTRSHEYLLVFARNKNALPNFSAEGGFISDRAIKKLSRKNRISEIDFPAGLAFEGKDAVFEGDLGKSEKQTVISERMVFENGKLKYPVRLAAAWSMRNQILSWLDGKETFDSKGQRVTRFFFNRQGILRYEKERGTVNPKTVIADAGSTKNGSTEIRTLFGEQVMDFPKPVALIKFLVKAICDEDDLVLDFFAGSCTTAHAVLEMNHEDGGRRQFICVQLPEVVPADSAAHRAGYSTIADVGKERIRRVIATLQRDARQRLPLDGRETPEDQGFRVFRLASSNFRVWPGPHPEADTAYIEQLALFNDPLIEGWHATDVLWEVAIREGYRLTSRVEQVPSVPANRVYRVHDPEKDQEFLLCLDDHVAERTPQVLRLAEGTLFVCRDSALDDTMASNLALQCRFKTI